MLLAPSRRFCGLKKRPFSFCLIFKKKKKEEFSWAESRKKTWYEKRKMLVRLRVQRLHHHSPQNVMRRHRTALVFHGLTNCISHTDICMKWKQFGLSFLVLVFTQRAPPPLHQELRYYKCSINVQRYGVSFFFFSTDAFRELFTVSSGFLRLIHYVLTRPPPPCLWDPGVKVYQTSIDLTNIEAP